uniref:Dynein light chain n=1 Tax=Oncorhynchus tshawytscha TaxID=74940 RepID=A0AAZ3QRT0_ONCTS
MTDRKAVIKNADMSEDMQQDAVDCATQAMEKYNIEKDIAAYIKKPCFCFFINPYRNLTRSITQHGIALLGGTSAATSLMRQSISSTSIWGRWPSSSSSLAEFSEAWSAAPPNLDCNALVADVTTSHTLQILK